MKARPDVSVIIPVYNRVDAVCETLLSLSSQTLGPQRFEVIVVDDGSSDSSVDKVTELQPQLPFQSSLVYQCQQGPAAARNHGATAAQGSVLLFWDSDMIAAPYTLQRHVDLHVQQDSIMVAGGRRPWEPAFQSTYARTLYLGDGPLAPPHFRRGTFHEVSSANLSLAASDFAALGGFDENLRAFEDVDLAYRAERAGLKLICSEDAFGYHNHPLTFDQDCDHQRRYQVQALLFLHKHPELQGTIEHLFDKGPVDWRHDAPPLIVRKTARWALARPPSLSLLKQLVVFLEKRYPRPALLRFLYTKVLSSYLLLGYREGIRRYGLPPKPTPAGRKAQLADHDSNHSTTGKHGGSSLTASLPLPTFLVIGAQKCGTSWLYEMLRQHPEVTVSEPKEVHYFNKVYHHSQGIDWYCTHFSFESDTRAVGDFTPNYFWTSDDPKEIAESERTEDIPRLVYETLPEAKLIVSLRNPVSRAISAYYHLLKHGQISPRHRILDVLDRFGIVSMGYYDLHLQRWMNYFSRDQFLILIYEEDIQDQKLATLTRVFRHIVVEESFVPEGLQERYNVRTSHFDMRIARLSPSLGSALRHLLPDRVKRASFWNIPVGDAEIEVLESMFATHTSNLSKILGRTLPWS